MTGGVAAAGGAPGDGAPLVPLGAAWRLWPVVSLRSAGMPARDVLRIGEPERPEADAPGGPLAPIVLDNRFLEAVTWQNPAMLRTWLAAYAERLARGDATLTRRAKREAVLARYLQRYTTKNETIGFFGPVAWAVFDPSAALAMHLGLAGRERYRRARFEPWAIARLAEKWGADPEIRRHLRPRRDPSSRIRADRLIRPRRPAVALDDDEAAVLERCDGRGDAEDILSLLRRERPELGFTDAAEVLSVLGRLDRLGCLLWSLRVPFDERAEEHLLRQLAQVPGERATRYRAELGSLTDLRAKVEETAGDPGRLASALDDLALRYAELSGGPEWRPKTESRSGRGILWLDCLADWDITLGEPLRATLERPLALLLTACRWLTWRVAQEIEAVVRDHVGATPDGRMPFPVLLAALAPELASGRSAVLDRVIGQFQLAVRRILPIEAGSAVRAFSTDEVATRWRAEFDAPAPGWASARVHSPDLMLAAPGPEAIRADQYGWVLSELHVAVNTIDNRCLAGNHPNPGLLRALLTASIPGRRYVPAFPAHWPDINPRGYPSPPTHLPDRLVYWSLEPDDVLPEHLPRLPCAGLDTVIVDGRPTVTDGDRLAVPFVEFIGELLSFLVGNAFQPFAPAPHLPRVLLDRLVVQRETWRFPVGELSPRPDDPRSVDGLVRAWRAAGVPRFCFVQVPGERKPIYCDLTSRPLVRNVVRLLAESPGDAVVRAQEMLPDFDHLWLRGADGRRRTSEFRMVAVDTVGVPG